MKKYLLACIVACIGGSHVAAQEWMRLHRTFEGVDWAMPIKVENGTEVQFNAAENRLCPVVAKDSEAEIPIPYNLAQLDSIDFAQSLTDEEKGHNRYRPFAMYITTEDETAITEKETWLRCHIAIDGKGEYSNFSGTGRIRGRGNSSWEWYDKKPYKFKLDSKSKLLGLDKAKNWNLLANYRDVTDLMNTFAFETARWMGMPYTNHTRYVEVFLNQQYIGLYQLTEKIEIKANRIPISETEGLLMSFDQDDGPSLSPYDGDNFSSKVFGLPMCVKTPEGLTEEQIDSIREDFAQLETAIKAHDYARVDSLMDIPSFIGILQLHEYLYNVEIDAPRSLYMFKDKGGKYTFGPVWDWDAGFDFDWGTMTTGHHFFSSYTELIYGTDPQKGTGAAYNINKFWREMFGNATFVKKYKDTWAALSDSIYLHGWAEAMKYADALTTEGAYKRDIAKWPMRTGSTVHNTQSEIQKMSDWLRSRKDYLDDVIAGYPNGDNEIISTDIQVVGTIRKTQNMTYEAGYSQSGSITINSSEVSAIIGGAPTDLVPLNSDGSEGNNTAAGTYGAWFNDEGDTDSWSEGHVYIESDNLYSWNYGCHPDNCWYDETHVVTMQYRRKNKAVNVVITFNVK